MSKTVTLIITFVISAVAFSQEDAYVEDVKRCIKSNGTFAYYENGVDQMFTMLEKQYASQEVPETVWEELKKLKIEYLDDLSKMLISTYRDHFNHKDVRRMNALYASKAGQNMLNGSDDLTEKDKEVLAKFYLSDTGQKISESQEVMNISMSQISKMWRSSFYQDVVEKLSNRGFNL